MSTKATSKKEDKAETVLTRNKTSQMTRRLRNTTKSMKRITQITKLLRTPTREEEPPPSNKRSKVKDKLSKKEHSERNTKKIKNSKEIAKKSDCSKKQYSNIRTYGKSKKECNNVDEKVPNSKIETKYEIDASDLLVVDESMDLVKRADDEEFFPEKVRRRRRKKVVVMKPEEKTDVGLKLVTGVKIAGYKRVMDAQQEALKAKRPKVSEPVADFPNKQDKPNQEPDITPSEDNKEPKPSSSSPVPSDMDLETQSLTDEDLLEILTCESPVWWEEGPGGLSEEPLTLKDFMQNGEATTIKNENKNVKNEESKKHQEYPAVTKTRVFDHKFMNKRSKLENLLSNIKNKICNEPENVEKSYNNHVKNNNNSDNGQINLLSKNITEYNQNEIKNRNKINDSNEQNNKTERKSRRKQVVSKKIDILSESPESDDILFHLPYEAALENLENLEIPIEKKYHTIIIDDDDEDEVAFVDYTEFHNEGSEKVEKDFAKKVFNDKATLQKLPKILNITSIQETSSPISNKSSVLSDTNIISRLAELDTISDTNIQYLDEFSSDKNSEDTTTENSKVNDKLYENKQRNTKVSPIKQKNNKKSPEKQKNNKKSPVKQNNDKNSTMYRLKQAYKELCSKNINTMVDVNTTSNKAPTSVNTNNCNKMSKTTDVIDKIHVDQNSKSVDENSEQASNNADIAENSKKSGANESKKSPEKDINKLINNANPYSFESTYLNFVSNIKETGLDCSCKSIALCRCKELNSFYKKTKRARSKVVIITQKQSEGLETSKCKKTKSDTQKAKGSINIFSMKTKIVDLDPTHISKMKTTKGCTRTKIIEKKSDNPETILPIETKIVPLNFAQKTNISEMNIFTSVRTLKQPSNNPVTNIECEKYKLNCAYKKVSENGSAFNNLVENNAQSNITENSITVKQATDSSICHAENKVSSICNIDDKAVKNSFERNNTESSSTVKQATDSSVYNVENQVSSSCHIDDNAVKNSYKCSITENSFEKPAIENNYICNVENKANIDYEAVKNSSECRSTVKQATDSSEAVKNSSKLNITENSSTVKQATENRSICNVENKVSSTCNIDDKAIMKVSDGSVKYCRKCSSIFDTERCGYCIKKENKHVIIVHRKGQVESLPTVLTNK